MADTYVQVTNTGQTVFTLPFSSNYLLKSHVKVYKGRDLLLDTQTSTLSEGSDYTFSSATQITLATGLAAGEELTIQRQTPKTSQLSPWNDGSNLTAEEMNKADLQCLYVVQEQNDLNALNAVKAQSALTNSTNAVNIANAALPKAGGSMSGVIAMGTNKITGLGDPTAAQDAVTKAYLERTGSITTTQISDGTLVDGDISNTAEINVSKLKDGSARQLLQTNTAGSGVEWTSNVDVPGTLDATGAVDFDSTLNVDGTATFATVDINSGAIDGTTIGANSRAVGNFTNVNANGTITGNLTGNVTGNLTGNTTGNITGNVTGNLTGDVTGDVTGDLTGNADTATDLAASTKITDTEQAAHTANNTTYFTTKAADARYFNISSGDTIKDGQAFPDNDTTIATTAAINDRIIDLVDDVGGFVPIANETSFPTANPDVNNGTGTLVSIKEFASSHTPSGGSVTIANGAGSGNTVTITGCGSTVLAAGFGGIVETTSTLHTYTFHRLSPKSTEVSTVAGISTNVTTVAGISGNVTTVAGVASNVTSVAGIASNVTTVAGIASNVTSVAGIASDVTTVANDATDIGAVAAKTTEIGRLGTADAVADLNTLGTTAIVSDLDVCATNISNINNVGGSIANVNSVASNLSTVNDFGARYRVASSDPTSNNDEGDLVFNTTSNELRVYNGSAWQGGVTATGNLAGLGANTFTGAQTFISSQTFDGRDVSVDGAKLDTIESNSTADQTDAEIRAAVESASDSNVFTDADHTKLNAIEANSTADQTDAEIRAAVEAASDSNVFTDADHTKLNGIAASANNYSISSDLLDEDNFGSNSATKPPSQQSVKAYVDALPDVIDEDSFATNSATRPPSQQSVKAYAAPKASPTFTGTVNAASLTLSGGLTVNGTTTTINSTTLNVDDKNIVLGDVSSPSDTTADGGGITLKGASDKTFNWVNSTDAWTSSEHIHLGDNKKLFLGSGSDTYIAHDGTNTDIATANAHNIWIRNVDGTNEAMAAFRANGASELYFDGTKRISTTNSGANIVGELTVNGAALSSAPTIEAVASGSLTEGVTCFVNSDGTVQKITVTNYSDAVGSDANAKDDTDTLENESFDSCQIAEDKIAVCWVEGELYIAVGTISGTTITWGTPLATGNGETSGHNHPRIDYEATSGCLVAIWYETYNTRQYMRAFSISGTTLTAGALHYPIESHYGKAPALACGGGGCVAYFRHQPTEAEIYGITVNGTTRAISTGSHIGSSQESGLSQNPYNTSLSYNPTRDCFLLTYNWSDNTEFQVISRSGTSLTSNHSHSISSSNDSKTANCYEAKTGNHVVVVRRGSTLVAYKANINSSKQVSVGSVLGGVESSDNCDFMTLAYNDELEIVFCHHSNFDSNRVDIQRLIPGDTTVTNMSGGQIDNIPNFNVGARVSICNGGSGKVVTFNPSTSSYTDVIGNVRQFAHSAQDKSVTDGNFVGFSAGSYSNGNTATINVTGNTTTQSGLTTATKYYVQSNGTLGTTSTNNLAGIALSSTKLLIKG